MPNLKDFEQTRKLTTRETEAQLKYQDQTHQDAVGMNQLQGAIDLAEQGNDQGSDYYAAQAGNILPTTDYKNQFDKTKLQPGNLAQSAYDRITGGSKTGVVLTPEQAVNKLNSPEQQKNIQGAMENVGKNLTPRGNMPAGYVDPSTIQPTETAGAPESPASVDSRRNDAAVTNAKLIQIQEERDQAAQKAKEGKEPQIEQPPSPLAGAMQSALMGLDPEEQALLAPLIAQIESNLQKDTQGNEDIMKTMLEGGTYKGQTIEGIRPTFDSIKSDLEQQRTDQKAFFDIMQETAKEMRDETQKVLSEKQESANNQLEWMRQKEEMRISKEKTKQHESLVAQWALGGGFAQDAALREVRESDASFDSQFANLQTEVGMQRTDIAARFSGMYLENQNAYRASSMQNMKDLKDSLQNISNAGIANKKTKAEAEMSLMEKSWEKEVAARKEYTTSSQKAIEQMIKMANDEKKSKSDASEAAYKSVLDAFTKFPAGSKERSSAIALYKASGGKIDFNDKTQTIEELNKAADGAGNNFIAENFGKFRDAETGTDLALAISSVISGKGIATADERTARRNELMFLLQGGEPTKKAFNQLLMNTAYIALDTDERKQVDAKTQVRSAIENVKESLANLTPEQQSKMQFWAKKYKGIANFLDIKNDPEFVTMMSNITYPMASLRKELFGSALTVSELAFSDVFLANPMKEDLSDSLAKLESIDGNLHNDITNLYVPRLGSKKLYEQLEKNGIVPTASPAISDWNKTVKESIDGDVQPSGELMTMKVGDRKVTGDTKALLALLSADDEFYQEMGEHLFVNSHYRTRAEQQAARDRFERGEIAAAAKPGTSLHEKGLAFDITNYEKARPYLARYGFKQFDTKKDPGHFSFGITG